MAEHNFPEQAASVNKLTDVQQKFIDYVTEKAGVEFTGDKAVTLYRVNDDSLVDNIAFIRERQSGEDEYSIEYLEEDNGYPLCTIWSTRAKMAEAIEETWRNRPFGADYGSDSSSEGLTDKMVEPYLRKLERIEELGRLSLNEEATAQYRQNSA